MMTRRAFLKWTLGSSALLALGITGRALQENSRRPNILLFIADDLGVDKIEIYRDLISSTPASSQPTMSNLERMAECGVLFRLGWAHPVCSPTRASIYTGLYPYLSGIGSPVEGTGLETEDSMGNTTITLAEALAEQGYQSALFGKWHVGQRSPAWPINRGWQSHAGTLGGVLPDYANWTKETATQGDDAYVDTQTTTYATADVVEEASAWIDGMDDRPWWATLAFNAPHTPFHEPNDSCNGVVVDSTLTTAQQYDRMVECLDSQIGTLLDGLSDEVLANTLIFFIGDNGSPAQVAAISNKAKETVYVGGVHVPIVVADGAHWVAQRNSSGLAQDPLIDSPGRISDSFVHVVDLYATIGVIAGASTDIAGDTNSIDFSGILRDSTADSARDHLFSQMFSDDGVGATIMARSDSHKLNYQCEGDTPGCYELFDLAVDPDETSNLFGASELAEIQEELLSLLQQNYPDATLEPFPEGAGCTA